MPPSINNPIAFFQEFLFDGYLKFYKSFFHPGEGAYLTSERLIISKERKTRDIAYTTTNKFNGEDFLLERIDYFPDLLNELLSKERFKALQLIDEKLNTSTFDGQKLFVENLFHQVMKLNKDSKEQITDKQDFEIISESLKYILNEVLATYPNLSLKPDLHVRNFLKLPEGKTNIKSFKMNLPYLENVGLLFNGLKEDGFIATETEFEVFKNAFNGSEIKNPTFIRWTAKATSSFSSRPLLSYFIKYLIENEIIEYIKYPKIIIIKLFGDYVGNKMNSKSFSSTTSQSKKNKKPSTYQLDNLKEILSAFKAQKLS